MYYDPMECGMRISKLRMECGKTQQQMADKLNIKKFSGAMTGNVIPVFWLL